MVVVTDGHIDADRLAGHCPVIVSLFTINLTSIVAVVTVLANGCGHLIVLRGQIVGGDDRVRVPSPQLMS